MVDKCCETCKYEEADKDAKVCHICIYNYDLYDNWEPKPT